MRPTPLRYKNVHNPEPAGEPERDYDQVNLLALLYRRMKNELFLIPRRMSSMLVVYLKDPRSGIKQTSKARSSEQSNLKRGLSRPGMTVKNFTKALRVIRPLSIKFTFELELPNDVKIKSVVTYSQDKLFSVFNNKTQSFNYNFLREIWDHVYLLMDFTDATWKQAVTRHLDKPESGYADKRNLKSSERSNLKRGLECANMTIENFTKALLIIEPVMIRLKVDLQLDDESHSTHMAEMEGTSFANSIFDEEDCDGNA